MSGRVRGALTPSAPDARARVSALVRSYGWNSTSFQLLEPGLRYFFEGEDAAVAYVETRRAWIAAGAPLCAEERLAAVSGAFVEAARAAGRRACFFSTEERFTSQVALSSLLIGEEAVWDPAAWPETVRTNRSLREQLRRAHAKGVRVRPVSGAERTAPDSPTRTAAAALVERWLNTRELAPMGFLVNIQPLVLLPEHRLFVAERDGELVALLSGAPIYPRMGWLLQNLIRSPDAPNGTIELLVDRAMRTAMVEAPGLVTLGLAPLAGPVPVALRVARALAGGLYDFEGLRAFKAKLKPTRWSPLYLSYPAEVGAVRAISDVLEAFARDGILRFGLRTLLRGPAVVVRLLALLLLPWTVLLASTSANRWFPQPAVKWGWVTFDAVLSIALIGLGRRWNERLARLLTAAIGADALVTAIEAVAWNLPRTAGLERLALALSIAGPTAASLTLWRARLRRKPS
jgi:phosphatidylglycerol lysyltransferase